MTALTAEEAGLACACAGCGERMVWGEWQPATIECRLCGTLICACCGASAPCDCAETWDPALDAPVPATIEERLAALAAAANRREQYVATHDAVRIEQIGRRRGASWKVS